jgi:hypothetical protein
LEVSTPDLRDRELRQLSREFDIARIPKIRPYEKATARNTDTGPHEKATATQDDTA